MQRWPRCLMAVFATLSLQIAGVAQAFANHYAAATLGAAAILQKSDSARGDLRPGTYVEVEDDRPSAATWTSAPMH